MISRLYNFLLSLKSNLWFVPAMLSLFSFLALFGVFYIEKNYLNEYEVNKFFFNIAKPDAKSFVMTLLSSMITLATLAISITMIVLSVAASQLGPRILKTFMSDRVTKYYIGFFFSVVMACFTLALILHDTYEGETSYQITANIVFVLSFLNLFALLGFLNHVAKSCIADNVIITLSGDLIRSVRRIASLEHKHAIDEDEAKDSWPKDFLKYSTPIVFERSGYVQNINYDDIMTFADKRNMRIKIDFEAGYYVIAGEECIHVMADDNLDTDDIKTLRSYFIIGNQRTPTQDIEYSIRHLVEIALRALSPGINDAFTAINVIDHLTPALADLFQNKTPPEWMGGDDGTPRMWVKRDTDSDLIFAAFDQIRHSAKDQPHVLTHLRQKLDVLKNLTKTSNQKDSLKQQIRLLGED